MPPDPLRCFNKGDPVDVGRDLFDAYRPCYIRAFNDAKDIVDDKGGKVDQCVVGVYVTDVFKPPPLPSSPASLPSFRSSSFSSSLPCPPLRPLRFFPGLLFPGLPFLR